MTGNSEKGTAVLLCAFCVTHAQGYNIGHTFTFLEKEHELRLQTLQITGVHEKVLYGIHFIPLFLAGTQVISAKRTSF